MNYFLYARKSTDVEDKQILSIESQLAELRELAKRESIYISDEFIEKRSAKIPGRPVFNNMLSRIQNGDVVLLNPNASLAKLFEITKIHEVFTICETFEEAKNHFNN